MINNGWISVFDSERPTSKEEVLTLCYTGTFPAPADMFEDPDDRSYGVCTYFYAGDSTYDDTLIDDPSSWIKRDMVERIIEEEGFYDSCSEGPDQLCRWRKLATIDEGNPLGIVCWKHLDYPYPLSD